ncbi:MAG TPA: PQQ-dependent sugar dehydrogenase, partial [Candidatus Eisenbacteria bacterium]
MAFSPDGRVFVAEKSGAIRVFASLTATTSTLFANLSTNVFNYADRGMLGLALDPGFPTTPYVYVLYSYDGNIGGPAPKWGGGASDTCPAPPGATADGCTTSSRLSRLQASGSVMTGSEQVLIHDWFQQYPSHSIGSIFFGSDGALYASGGDGASYNWADYGQDGNPLNPGGDPPVGVGGVQTPPLAEGGALRSQDLRTSGDPVGLAGTVIRVNPATGAGFTGNPLISSSDANARRIIAYGLRNPFRMTKRPGSSEIWIGDVGWGTWEEINRIGSVTSMTNFGWPCYEGAGKQSSYDGLNLNICENLYTQSGAVTAPIYTYNHSAQVVSGETCPTGSSSISGLAFYPGGTYPAE